MGKDAQQQLDELFSPKNSGAMRVFLFAKFYEDLLREYLAHKGYEVCPGKPQIFWKKVPVPTEIRNESHAKLTDRLKNLQKNALYCTPDGLLIREKSYLVWEAKNWVQELYPSPFSERIWDFAWLLAQQVLYRGQTYPISGFLLSWWERENGMDKTLSELRRCISPMKVELIITKDVLYECITAQYPWYTELVKKRQRNIDQFFEVLLGKEIP